MGLIELHRRRFLGNPDGGGGDPPTSNPNLFIGGVSSTVNSESTLATRLGITTNDISYFAVVGSDIEAEITSDYTLSDVAFTNNLNITFFRDELHCKKFYARSFAGAEKLTEIKILKANRFYKGSDPLIRNYALVTINIPKVLNYDLKHTSQGIFNSASPFASGCTITVDTSMQTINNGSLEGDLALAETKGAVINYVVNDENTPETITDLAIGTQYKTALQLNFTAPTSVNEIKYYEVSIGGVIHQKITAPGAYITSLSESTPYTSITVKTVDIYGNKSNASNSVDSATNTTASLLDSLVGFYPLKNSCEDYHAGQDGTNNGVYFESDEAIFDGTSQIKLPSNIFNNPSEYSFSGFFTVDDTASEYRAVALNDNTGAAFTLLRFNAGAAGEIQIYGHDGVAKTVSTTAYTITNKLHIGGSFTENGNIELFVQGVSVGTVAIGTFNQVTTNNNHLGSSRSGASAYLKGKQSKVSFYNKALTQSEFQQLANGLTL